MIVPCRCIQASINVLEAKAEENARAASGAAPAPSATAPAVDTGAVAASEAAGQNAEPVTPQPQDATKMQEPIPLPAPPNAAAVEGAAASEATAAEATQSAVQSETTTTTSEWWTQRLYKATVSKQLRKLTKFKWQQAEDREEFRSRLINGQRQTWFYWIQSKCESEFDV